MAAFTTVFPGIAASKTSAVDFGHQALCSQSIALESPSSPFARATFDADDSSFFLGRRIQFSTTTSHRNLESHRPFSTVIRGETFERRGRGDYADRRDGGRRPPRINTDPAYGNVTYITCPECQTAFAVLPTELRDDGRLVKCSECNHEWSAASTDIKTLDSLPKRKKAEINIFVGNLSFNVNDEDLRGLFEQYGEVVRAQVATDKESGRSRGFAFVEMTDRPSGQKAIEELNGATVNGRNIAVDEAQIDPPRGPRPDRPEGGGGG
eukprot:CAMPEP_0184348632 /NCGR_PEP_ID=MMETSP1089-20130417/27789_1 /TAXON_ID=38269 ORGANISM="Gloeochaete wittrockiana, Strain SAG46.84" /NCGR_SAMPLE_ID=MMETSP1089 /ASSEMBLY_ACC=CAM_ASM_000445 /LENGTH=265 /DNA_ID=CAMNT_0026680413 /DNA_START=29 /DNA_END=822 /DNA_ORIENTATION=+